MLWNAFFSPRKINFGSSLGVPYYLEEGICLLQFSAILNSKLLKFSSPPQPWQFMTLTWHWGWGHNTKSCRRGTAALQHSVESISWPPVSVTPLSSPVSTKAHSCWKQHTHYPALKSLCSLSSDFDSQLGYQCLLWSNSSAATCGLPLLFVLWDLCLRVMSERVPRSQPYTSLLTPSPRSSLTSFQMHPGCPEPGQRCLLHKSPPWALWTPGLLQIPNSFSQSTRWCFHPEEQLTVSPFPVFPITGRQGLSSWSFYFA